MGDLIEGGGDVIKGMAIPGIVRDLWFSNTALTKVDLMSWTVRLNHCSSNMK